MKKIFTVALVCIFFANLSFSQNQNKIWYFGNNAGIDFNGAIPVALTNGALSAWDCSAAISDSSGQLLFYTNGLSVWNRLHALMLNGTGLAGGGSAGQAALIVPQPGSSLYYIFTVDEFAGSNGFNYSIVDMNSAGGYGDVISKNNLLFTPSTERIDAVYNPGDNSYWIVTHRWNSNEFSSYKLSSAGLNANSVLSSVGPVHTGGVPTGYNAIGQLTISPAGNKLVCARYSDDSFDVFDFDKTTGVVSNPQAITGYTNAFGAAFSPDGSKLYVTQLYGQNVTQFDLNQSNWTNVIASATIIGAVTGPGSQGYYAGYPQLAPDGKIYIASFNDTHLAIISNPNAAGTGCNFIDNGFSLSGKTSSAGICRSIPVGNPTGINESNPQVQLNINYNSTSQQISIQVSGNLSAASYLMNLYDASGRLIRKATIMQNQTEVIPTSQFSKGIYFAELNGVEGRIKTQRIGIY